MFEYTFDSVRIGSFRLVYLSLRIGVVLGTGSCRIWTSLGVLRLSMSLLISSSYGSLTLEVLL